MPVSPRWGERIEGYLTGTLTLKDGLTELVIFVVLRPGEEVPETEADLRQLADSFFRMDRRAARRLAEWVLQSNRISPNVRDTQEAEALSSRLAAEYNPGSPPHLAARILALELELGDLRARAYAADHDGKVALAGIGRVVEAEKEIVRLADELQRKLGLEREAMHGRASTAALRGRGDAANAERRAQADRRNQEIWRLRDEVLAERSDTSKTSATRRKISNTELAGTVQSRAKRQARDFEKRGKTERAELLREIADMNPDTLRRIIPKRPAI